jgi:hypothetical protein
MSEYQYYEFQTADRPLNEKQMQELRAYSTRARITVSDGAWAREKSGRLILGVISEDESGEDWVEAASGSRQKE